MSSLMSVGKSAMFASYAALQTASNNIANANTEGYSRQSVHLADATSQETGGGYLGKGVDVTTVSRAYDKFLTNAALSTGSVSAADTARLDKLTQLEAVFSTGTSGIGYAAGQFMNSFVDLASTPADSSARQVVLSQAQDLASQFRTAGDQLSDLQSSVTQDIRTAVASVNEMAKQVASLNYQIAGVSGKGQPPNQLLDQRDQLVQQIGQLINVTTVSADDGSLALFIGGGQNLVLGAHANTLKAAADPFDPAKAQLAVSEMGADRLVPQDVITGGSIAGALRFQNSDLVEANNLLGQLSAAISGAVNLQQSLGLDLRQPAGSGAPIFAVGAPRVLGASGNTGTAALSVTVTGASQLQASDYELKFNGTNYTLIRNSDQQAVTGSPFTAAQMSTGVSFDGVSLQLSAGAALAGDRFQVQPVTHASQSMAMVLADPKGLAAASPFTASVGTNNRGTATIASVTAVSAGYNGALTASITFTSNAGNYNWSLSNGTSGTGTWAAGSPISLNGFALKLDGVPSNGDTLSVVPTVSVSGNNGNALAFSGLGTARIVGATAGTLGYNITDAYAQAIAEIGVRVQGGKTAAHISQSIAADAKTSRNNKSGVNLDEEAARLIQFQQSYQAAAKILQVAQTIFQTMLQAAGS